jgi:hypothetical protein
LTFDGWHFSDGAALSWNFRVSSSPEVEKRGTYLPFNKKYARAVYTNAPQFLYMRTRLGEEIVTLKSPVRAADVVRIMKGFYFRRLSSEDYRKARNWDVIDRYANNEAEFKKYVVKMKDLMGDHTEFEGISRDGHISFGS